jgi:hypothetical protein
MTVKGSAKAPKLDRYTPWYTIGTWALFLLFWVDLDRIYNLYLAVVPLLVLPALIWAAVLVISLVVNAIRRRWRRTISIVLAPIIAATFFLLLGRMGLTTEFIRLELQKSSYLAEVESLPPTVSGCRLKTWNWGSTGGAAVSNFFWILVYDDCDQIALPRSSQSAEWAGDASRADKNGMLHALLYDDDNTTLRHLDGHFYVVERVWPYGTEQVSFANAAERLCQGAR